MTVQLDVYKNCIGCQFNKRIEFKIISLVHKCIHGNAPPYLQRLIQYTKPTRKGLRSEEDTTRLVVPPD